MQSLPYGLCLAAGQYFVGGPKNAVTAFKNATKGVRTMANRSFVPTQEEISQRAYEIYVSRGRKNGGDIDDWLAAERELRERQSGSSQTKRPILLTGSATERPAPAVEQNFQEALRVNAMRQNAARDNATRDTVTQDNVTRENALRENMTSGDVVRETVVETTERESEPHFKLPRPFLGSNR